MRCVLSIRKAKKRKRTDRFVCVLCVFLLLFFDDDLSPVWGAMCDILLLSAVKESIYLEEEQAKISNAVKKKANQFDFLPVFWLFNSFFSFNTHKKERVGLKESQISITILFCRPVIWQFYSTYTSCIAFVSVFFSHFFRTKHIKNLQLQHHQSE